MIALLIDPQGIIRKEWATDNSDSALGALRNLPPGWTVEFKFMQD